MVAALVNLGLTSTLLLVLLMIVSRCIDGQVKIDYFKEMFVRDFHRTCDRYPFVKQYIDTLRNPPNRFIVFVYSEDGLKNGGIGDRFGGLISATAIALRFNRTLIVEANDGLDSLFQPYFPPGLRSVNNHSVFSYKKSNWTEMYNYNHSLSNNDNNEYDLYMCINQGTYDAKCGMDNGDVPHPIIKLRGNRAYLCKWAEKKELKAHSELYGLGLDDSDDLWEAAGCMMRLALWPTEEMWLLANTILASINTQTKGRQSKGVDTADPAPATATTTATTTTAAAPVSAANVTGGRYFQVGVHFRCGDHSYLHKQWADDLCVTKESNQAMNSTGSPRDLGLCAGTIYRDHNLEAQRIAQRHYRALATSAPSSADRRLSIAGKEEVLLFVASDNDASSAEMSKYANYSNTFISPSGCHIERDKSQDCMKLTASHWFYLSFSDILITQTYIGNMATSGFSRSAAIYGLKHNSIRSGKYCNVNVPTYNISRQHQGNWYCK